MMNSAPVIVSKKIHALISIWYAKFSSHVLPAIHASGHANANASITRTTKSFESSKMMVRPVAPRIFRIPISLVRCTTEYEARPQSPRQEMNMAILVAVMTSLEVRCSA
jgi:hypothetical protein